MKENGKSKRQPAEPPLDFAFIEALSLKESGAFVKNIHRQAGQLMLGSEDEVRSQAIENPRQSAGRDVS
jgi:hypothetical protein